MNTPFDIFKVFCTCIVITIIYTILHDQVAFSISSDFFYRYSFYQYGIATEGLSWVPELPRYEVFKLSLYSSWWIGIILALVTCFVGFSDRSKSMKMRDFRSAFFIGITMAIITSGIGAFLGSIVDSPTLTTSVLFENKGSVLEHKNFEIARYMDISSYIGGAIGTLLACTNIYLIRKRKPSLTNRF